MQEIIDARNELTAMKQRMDTISSDPQWQNDAVDAAIQRLDEAMQVWESLPEVPATPNPIDEAILMIAGKFADIDPIRSSATMEAWGSLIVARAARSETIDWEAVAPGFAATAIRLGEIFTEVRNAGQEGN